MIWKRSEPEADPADTVGAVDTGRIDPPGAAKDPKGAAGRGVDPALDPAAEPPSPPPASEVAAAPSAAAKGTAEVRSPSGRPLRFASGPEDETIAEASVFPAGTKPGSSDTVGELDTAAPSWDDEPTQLWREGSVVAGRYRISGFLGQGGMGKVYVAEDEILRRPIALKRVPQEILYDLDARDDLRQEANRLLDLAHENIVRVHTYFDGPTWPFFAMEYLRGPTLKRLLRERKQNGRVFSAAEVLVIAQQVGRGLTHAHAHNIVHRDLKPANLMLAEPPHGDEITAADVIKITDFGISRAVADSTLRQTGRRSGTLPYMSPEQFLGEPSTVQSDIYSLACTLYELLTGRTPFHTGDIGYQILKVDPRPLPVASAPRPMASAIRRALSKRPADRFESIAEFVDALETGAPPPPRRRHQALAVVVSLALVSFLGWGLSSVLDGSRGPLAPRGGAAAQDASGSVTTRAAAPVRASWVETRFLKSEIDAFRDQLRKALDAQLGTRPLGAPPDLVSVDGGEPRRDFLLELAEGPSGFSPELLNLLEFRYHRTDDAVAPPEAETVHVVTGVSGPRGRTFRFADLVHGTYRLMAYLNGSSGEPSGPPLIPFEVLGSKFTFAVDLKPPEFRVSLVEDQIVDPRQPSTFDAEIGFALVPEPGFSGDIARAYLRDTTKDSSGPIAIPDPSRGQISLPQPGNLYTFEVWAFDAAGNMSGKEILDVRRNALEVKSLQQVSFSGRVVDIRGLLKYEGAQHPELEFWVNGDIGASPPGGELRFESSLEGLAVSDDDLRVSIPGAQPFVVRLLLPALENSIEVRYRWKGSDAKPFAKPARLDGVVLPPPSITLDQDITETTQQAMVTLSGRVRPFYEGLELKLEHTGKTMRLVELRPTAEGAVFSESVQLLRDQLNEIRLRPYFRNAPMLGPGAPVLRIRHDETPPECLGAEVKEASYSEIVAEVRISEPLALLSGRVVLGPLDDPGFYDLPLHPAAQERTRANYEIRLPFAYREGCELEIKMKDLAGNINTARRPLIADSDRITAAPPSSRSARAPMPAPIARSQFLRELAVRFVSFGGPAKGLEIMRTEVPVEAWNRFLLEERGETIPPPAEKRLPMTLERRPVSLVQDFVRWFQRRADDGYEYFVPTAEQWMCAFVDVDDLAAARERIAAWFAKDFTIAAPSADFRYGLNKPLPVGSRKMVETPATGLLDMEANVQELVFSSPGESLFAVIGGFNQHQTAEAIRDACLYYRSFDPDQQAMRGHLTGLRLCRRPASQP